MEQLRFIVISVTLLLCTANAFAQRHYENISALEINYGANIFGDADNYTSFSFSKYINRKSYWKTGVGYFEKSDEYSLPKNESPVIPESGTPIGKRHDKGMDFYLDGGYYRTLASNLKSIYWNVGIGGFIGVEYLHHPQKEYTFIIVCPSWKPNWKYSYCPEWPCLPAYNSTGIPCLSMNGIRSGI